MSGLSGFARAADRNKNSSTPKIIRITKGRVLNVIGDIKPIN
jgi:hypothetical protein